MKDAIEEMLKQEQIQPSNSPWSSPVVLVNKPDGTIRICIDYRKLNEITVPGAYPVLRISDILEKVGNAKFLSHFDLTKGYVVGIFQRKISLCDPIWTLRIFSYAIWNENLTCNIHTPNGQGVT